MSLAPPDERSALGAGRGQSGKVRPLERAAARLSASAPLVAVGALVAGLVVGRGATIVGGTPLVIAAFLGMFGVGATVLRPELGAFTVTALVVTRVLDVGESEHGVPSVLLPLVAALLVFARPWARRTSDRDAYVMRYVLLLGAYGLVLAASGLVAEDSGRTLSALFEWAKAVLTAMTMIAVVRDPAGLRRASWGFVVGGAFIATISLYQFVTNQFENDFFGMAVAIPQGIVEDEDFSYRIAGSVGDPNFFAAVLVATVPFSLERARNGPHPVGRAFALLAALVSGITAVVTYSRGGAIGLAVVLVMCALRVTTWRVVLSTLGVLLVGAALLAPPAYHERVADGLEALPGVGADVPDDSAVRGRSSEMLSAARMFADHPVLGVGFDNYPVNYADYARHLGLDFRPFRTPHSLPLQVAAETGLLGLLAFGAVLLFVHRSLAVVGDELRADARRRDADLVDSVRISLTGFLVCSLFLHAAYPQLLWLLLALGAATWRAARPSVVHTDAIALAGAR